MLLHCWKEGKATENYYMYAGNHLTIGKSKCRRQAQVTDPRDERVKVAQKRRLASNPDAWPGT